MRAVSSLYVHLPFCRKKCFYCDFPVVAGAVAPAYMSALLQDMRLTRAEHTAAALHTVYLGGGTPTLLSESQLLEVIQEVRSLWEVADNAEVSIECDPGTMTPAKAQVLQSCGVNRISIGAQTLSDSVLSAAGRSHSVADFWSTVDTLTGAGYRTEQLAVDLIIGLPNVSVQTWRETTQAITQLRPGHFSTYFLTLEENTPFHHKYTEYKDPLPDEPSVIEMYTFAHDYATSLGYTHYEISNYALPGKECKHSLVYWSGNSEYLAVGLGAASYSAGVRFARPRQLSAYYQWVRTAPRPYAPAETVLDRLKHRMMYQMRRAIGIDLREYRRDFGDAIASAIERSLQPLSDSGVVVSAGENRRLSAPRGFLVSSAVLSDLFLAVESVP